MISKWGALLGSAMSLAGLTVASSGEALELRGVFGGGIDVGGDTVVVQVTSSGSVVDEITAGEGFSVHLGVATPLGLSGAELSVTAGWKEASRNRGQVTFSRFPIEAAILQSRGKHRFGMGLAYHSHIRISGLSRDPYNFSKGMKSEVGFTVSYGYSFHRNSAVGFKYTDLHYQLERYGYNADIDAGSWGMFFRNTF